MQHSRYLDIAAEIRRRVEAGEWEPGSRLPRRNDLVAEYDANRDTIGRAIAALESQGVLWAVQGRGIIVRHGMMSLRRPRRNLVKRNQATPSAGYSPFQINISWIHPRGVADAPETASEDPGPGHWLYLLEKAGHWPISWTEFHRACTPTPDEARLLEIPISLPVLEIVRVGTSGAGGKAIEVTEYVVAGDQVETVHVLHRDESARSPWPDIQSKPTGERP